MAKNPTANATDNGSQHLLRFLPGTPGGNPSINFEGFEDSGLWYDPNTGQIKMRIAGTDVMAVTSAGASSGKRIAVMGASGGVQSYLFNPGWPVLLGQLIDQAGVNAVVKNFCINAATCFRMNSQLDYGTKSQRDACIAWNPDIIIVSMGFNDAVTKVDGRTLAQIKADSDTLFTTLRNALPQCVIVYFREVGYDDTNFPTPGTTLKNKGVPPSKFTLRSSGLHNGLYSSAMLDDAVPVAMRQAFQDWIDFDTYVQANGKITAATPVRWWKILRLGCVASDGEHLSDLGMNLAAAMAFKQLRTIPAFTAALPNMSTQILADWQDPDVLFSDFLTQSGDGWVRNNAGPGLGEAVNYHRSKYREICPDEWYLPFKGRFQVLPNTGNVPNSKLADGNLIWTMFNAPPNAQTQVSLDGVNWINNTSITTGNGFACEVVSVGNLGAPSGAYTLWWRAGIEAYGPFSITFVEAGASQPSVGGTTKNLVESAATGIADISLVAGASVSGKLEYEIFATDTVDFQARKGFVDFVAVNKGGVITAVIGAPVESVAVSAGTLTVTPTIATGASKVTLQLNAVSSLVQTILRATWKVVSSDALTVTAL